MLRYRVYGADRHTGNDRAVDVTALSEREAIHRASQENVLASKTAYLEAVSPHSHDLVGGGWILCGLLVLAGVIMVGTSQVAAAMPYAEALTVISSQLGAWSQFLAGVIVVMTGILVGCCTVLCQVLMALTERICINAMPPAETTATTGQPNGSSDHSLAEADTVGQ